MAVPAQAPGLLRPCMGADGAPQARPAARSLLPATNKAGERAYLRVRHCLCWDGECRHLSLETKVCVSVVDSTEAARAVGPGVRALRARGGAPAGR